MCEWLWMFIFEMFFYDRSSKKNGAPKYFFRGGGGGEAELFGEKLPPCPSPSPPIDENLDVSYTHVLHSLHSYLESVVVFFMPL